MIEDPSYVCSGIEIILLKWIAGGPSLQLALDFIEKHANSLYIWENSSSVCSSFEAAYHFVPRQEACLLWKALLNADLTK